jgi:hypothetical protein
MQPEDLANRCLDLLGCPNTIGDLQDGSKESQVLLRHYGAVLRQISRGANWNCLRKKAELILLNDATGQTTQQQINAGYPVTVGTGTVGMKPWVYEYRWPPDCLKVRFVPRDNSGVSTAIPPGNLAIPATPLYTGQANVQFAREVPTRFLVTNDVVPNLVGAPTDWGQIPDTSQTLGQGLTSQTVILTNHPCATAVYTALITYPDQWDPLFQEAFVAMLATRVALPLVPDRKMAIAIRDDQIKIAKAALDQARISDGNEAWTSLDHRPDWLSIRDTGGGRWGGFGRGNEGGLGILNGGWDAVSFGGNDSAY